MQPSKHIGIVAVSAEGAANAIPSAIHMVGTGEHMPTGPDATSVVIHVDEPVAMLTARRYLNRLQP